MTAPDIGEKWLGKPDAPVTMIEYASATCPHCADFHANTFPTIKRDYIDTGKVRFAMREFPFDQLSLAAFMLARCAPAERYFDMLDVLFEQQKVWTGQNPRGELFKISKMAGFTQESFDACLKNEVVANGIIAIREHAKSLGVNSTPTFFVNGKKVEGSMPIGKFPISNRRLDWLKDGIVIVSNRENHHDIVRSSLSCLERTCCGSGPWQSNAVSFNRA